MPRSVSAKEMQADELRQLWAAAGGQEKTMDEACFWFMSLRASGNAPSLSAWGSGDSWQRAQTILAGYTKDTQKR